MKLLGMAPSLILLVLPLPAQAIQDREFDEKDVAPSFERVLPRGRIASIDKPEFVSADEAKIGDDSWVLGVEIDGHARAYSLSLLNHHEVVNDVVADKPISAVW
jgi:hypothetical protein